MNLLRKQFSIKNNSLESIRPFVCLMTAFALLCFSTPAWSQAKEGRDVIRISIVLVNPSDGKTQVMPVKTYLPVEVTPEDITNADGLTLEFDTTTSSYFLYGDDVELKPKEVRTFNIELRDAWIIKKDRLDALRNQAQSMIGHLQGTPEYEIAQKLGESINKALDTVEQTQNDESVSTKRHIGVYRSNLKVLDQVKDDIARLEKQAGIAASASAGAGASASSVLDHPKLKTDAPDKSTTWMIIFIIMAFMALLAGGFFVTWYAQGHFTKEATSTPKDPSSSKDVK